MTFKIYRAEKYKHDPQASGFAAISGIHSFAPRAWMRQIAGTDWPEYAPAQHGTAKHGTAGSETL
ncbi:hypothetical protein [Rubripirellula tenax]|uniref:hypothetical protein n=1 Tax=Rubripirellula tenax TaxID=2528015 RepID=UPI0011B5CAE6|nr:hypothetical protein [Rubripirellula tenax]